MNAPEKIAFLPDIQSQADNRHLRIDAVGVKGVRYPMTIRKDLGLRPTIATLSMTVGLPAVSKGTHIGTHHTSGIAAGIAALREQLWQDL